MDLIYTFYLRMNIKYKLKYNTMNKFIRISYTIELRLISEKNGMTQI